MNIEEQSDDPTTVPGRAFGVTRRVPEEPSWDESRSNAVPMFTSQMSQP